MPIVAPDELFARFEARVDKTSHPGGCWIWTGVIHRLGYGAFGKSSRAHRAAYEFYVAPIPAGLHVLHRCDNPACVNPAHLFLGTHTDNMRDRSAKGRTNAREGSDHHKAKLTEEQVREIRRRWQEEPHSYGFRRRMARDYGVTGDTIYRVASGKGWDHVH